MSFDSAPENRVPSPQASGPDDVQTAIPPTLQRVVAFLEVLLCSDYPTQLFIGAALSCSASPRHPLMAA